MAPTEIHLVAGQAKQNKFRLSRAMRGQTHPPFLLRGLCDSVVNLTFPHGFFVSS